MGSKKTDLKCLIFLMQYVGLWVDTKHFRRLDFQKIIENFQVIISNYGKAGDDFVGS